MVKVGIAAAVAALLLGALGACGDDPKPKIAHPSASPTVSAPSSPTPTQAAETPEAFIRRYIKVADKAQVTGDFSAYKLLSDPDCVSCNQYVEGIGQIYKHGGIVKFAGERVIWIHRVRKNFYKVRTSSPQTRYRERKAGPWKTLAGGEVTEQYSLAKHGNSWVVLDTAQVAGSAS